MKGAVERVGKKCSSNQSLGTGTWEEQPVRNEYYLRYGVQGIFTRP
jgi:hypothetical protein